jgi:hypothetical protein
MKCCAGCNYNRRVKQKQILSKHILDYNLIFSETEDTMMLNFSATPVLQKLTV